MEDISKSKLQMATYRVAIADALRVVRECVIESPIDGAEHHMNGVLHMIESDLRALARRSVSPWDDRNFATLDQFPFPAGSWVRTGTCEHAPWYVTGRTGDDGQTSYVHLVCCPLHPDASGEWRPAVGHDGSLLAEFKAAEPPAVFQCGSTMKDYARTEEARLMKAVTQAEVSH